MRLTRFTPLAVILLALFSVVPSVRAAGPDDERAVRALVAACIDGWNKGSGEAFAAQFAEDVDYVVINGNHIQGRTGTAKSHQHIFDTFYKGTTLSITVKDIRFIAPGVAVLHTIGSVVPPGETPGAPTGIQTMVVSKHGDRWLIDAFQNTPIEARPAGK